MTQGKTWDKNQNLEDWRITNQNIDMQAMEPYIIVKSKLPFNEISHN